MRARRFGSLRNTLGSISIPVETGRAVVGHLIIMELMGQPFDRGAVPSCPQWNPAIVTALRPPCPLWITSR